MINPFADVNWKPGRDELRAFARSMIIGLPVLAIAFELIVRWRTGAWVLWPCWLALAGILLGLIGSISPRFIRPIYVFWYAVGGTIGFIISNILLLLTFYLVITPVGLLLRCFGKDPLERGFDRKVTTYWTSANNPVDPSRYFRQF